jgi:hypothetical protein
MRYICRIPTQLVAISESTPGRIYTALQLSYTVLYDPIAVIYHSRSRLTLREHYTSRLV